MGSAATSIGCLYNTVLVCFLHKHTVDLLHPYTMLQLASRMNHLSLQTQFISDETKGKDAVLQQLS